MQCFDCSKPYKCIVSNDSVVIGMNSAGNFSSSSSCCIWKEGTQPPFDWNCPSYMVVVVVFKDFGTSIVPNPLHVLFLFLLLGLEWVPMHVVVPPLLLAFTKRTHYHKLIANVQSIWWCVYVLTLSLQNVPFGNILLKSPQMTIECTF